MSVNESAGVKPSFANKALYIQSNLYPSRQVPAAAIKARYSDRTGVSCVDVTGPSSAVHFTATMISQGNHVGGLPFISDRSNLYPSRQVPAAATKARYFDRPGVSYVDVSGPSSSVHFTAAVIAEGNHVGA
ncbi:hypothetical protein HPB50_008020 [Hyalomma asiaticum]|uniref:Uncharacterized protein n=1 Tax=Hyalomma asiaticum TaxID=266040 RepID=A0ACB7SFP5_HYAAI|nr:hypothetical protein HPB50_008020 [Hyalomma asiaticum]